MLRGRKRTLVAVLGALATTAVFVAAGSSAAAPGAKPDRGAVVAYWTPERVAHAVPREVSPKGLHVPQAGKPPGPGGGGGSGTTGGTTGAAWTGSGKVKLTTGKVLFTMAGVDYVCSGSVALDASSSTSLVLTAGHCVYDETNRAFATNWMFVPDYEDGGSIVTNTNGIAQLHVRHDPVWLLDGRGARYDDGVGERWRQSRQLQQRLRFRRRRSRRKDGPERAARRERRRRQPSGVQSRATRRRSTPSVIRRPRRTTARSSSTAPEWTSPTPGVERPTSASTAT